MNGKEALCVVGRSMGADRRFLPRCEGHVGGRAKDNRLFVEAVLYRYRAGITWRDLPEWFGDFRVIHTRHDRLHHRPRTPTQRWGKR